MLGLLLWGSPELVLLAIAVLSAGLAAVLWLYPPQLSGARLSAQWILPVLRTGAMVALGVSLLRPIAARPKTSQEKGAVVVLIDQSASMGVTESSQSPAQAVALADGLGLLSEGKRPDATAGLRADLENLLALTDRVSRARSEADYARLSGRGVEPARRRLDESIVALRAAARALAGRAASMAPRENLPQRLIKLRRLPAPLDDAALRNLRTELEEIMRSLASVQSDADAALYRSDPVVRAICNDLDGISRLSLVQRGLIESGGLLARVGRDMPVKVFSFGDGLKPLRASELAATVSTSALAGHTDITGALRRVTEMAAAQPLQAIVLFSDGRQVAGTSESSSDQPGEAPIFAVAAARQQRDVSIAGISIPGAALVGETLHARVELHSVGCKGRSVDVALETGGQRQNRRVTLNDSNTGVDFSVAYQQNGPQELVASVSAITGELSEQNNVLRRWVKVLPEKIAVAGAGRPTSRDYQYVIAALQRTPWVNVAPQSLFADADPAALSPEVILAQSVLVLCDLPRASFTQAQWEAVYQLVSERGGSVILLVGDESILDEYAADPLLSKLLPYDPVLGPSWRSWPTEQPHFWLTPPSIPGPQPQPTLGTLAPLVRFLPITQLKPNARALLVERSSSAAALTESRVGAGRVLFLGTDETWRWHDNAGGRDQDSFWRPLIRHAVEEPYAVREGNYWLDTDKVASEPHQPLRVRAKVLREDGTPARATSQDLQILRGGQLLKTVTMNSAPPTPGRYEALLNDLDEGDYELRVNTADDLLPPPRLTVRVAPSSEAEMSDLSPDESALRRLAESSGGQFLILEQLSSLPGRLADLRQRQVQLLEYPLWDSPFLFLFVLASFSAEWALRKRFGLA